MALKKYSSADRDFSLCIREAAGCCEICGRTDSWMENMHYFGRRAYSVRFDPNNCNAGCNSCHRFFTENPDLFREWKKEQVGEGMLQILREKREDTNLAKYVRKNLRDVAKHYREELKRIKSLRAEGVTGKIEIVGYV